MLTPSLLLAALIVAADGSAVEIPSRVEVAGGFAVPPPVGLEAALVQEARTGKPSGLDLLKAALVASGVPDPEVDRWHSRVTALLAPIRKRALAQKSASKRGHVLLSGLHDTLLRTYQANATDLTGVVERGEFNCVSSAVLFIVAADGILDEPRAVVSSIHAFARVTVAGKPVDVEATLREGFAPDRAVIFTPDVQRRLRLLTEKGAPADVVLQARNAAELPAGALVAAMYTNRAVDLLQEGNAAAAAVALDRALALSHGPQKARVAGWRSALLNNAALQLMEQKRTLEAVDLLVMALTDAAPDRVGPVKANLSTAWTRLADEQLDRGEPSAALVSAQAALDVEPGNVAAAQRKVRAAAELARQQGDTTTCSALVADAQAECLAAASTGLLHKGNTDAALAVARRARGASKDNFNARAALFNAVQRGAHAQATAGHCVEAEALWKESEAMVGMPAPRQSLAERAGACWFNVAVGLHKEGRFAESVRALERSLRYRPSDKAARGALATSAFNEAVPHVNAGRCDQARPWIARALKWDATAQERRRELLVACAQHAAAAAWDRKDFAAAEAAVRLGLMDAPDDEGLRKTLGAALYNQARTLVAAADCAAARPLMEDAAALGPHAPDLAPLLARCPLQQPH